MLAPVIEPRHLRWNFDIDKWELSLRSPLDDSWTLMAPAQEGGIEEKATAELDVDLFCFSGGKGLRGPQCAGVLLGRKDLIEAAKRSDIALGFETSTGFNNATVARRGASGWGGGACGPPTSSGPGGGSDGWAWGAPRLCQ